MLDKIKEWHSKGLLGDRVYNPDDNNFILYGQVNPVEMRHVGTFREKDHAELAAYAPAMAKILWFMQDMVCPIEDARMCEKIKRLWEKYKPEEGF